MGEAGRKGTKKLRKTKQIAAHGKLARMSSHGEAAAADIVGRPGWGRGGREPRSAKTKNSGLGNTGSLRG